MLNILLDVRDRTSPARPADPLILGLFIVIVIAIFVVYIFLLQYIYKDAVKRGLNPELWVIIVLIAPIPGIIVYFIVRKTER